MRNKNFRRFCALLLSVALMCGILPMTVMADGPSFEDVSYYLVGDSGTTAHHVCEVIDENVNGGVLTDKGTTGGWYVANNTDYLTYNGRIRVEGNIHLILANYNPFVVTGGINVAYGNSLTIYQGSDGNVPGLLGIYNLENEYAGYAGIGGDPTQTNGNITICGGRSIVACGNGGAGIGSGANATSSSIGKITIKAGNVQAFNRDQGNAAGIGGGDGSTAAPVEISGGKVSASGSQSGAVAGIGSGRYGVFNPVTISGGEVIAYGGENGPGIGSGELAGPATTNAKISITGGTVISQSKIFYGTQCQGKAFYSAKPGPNGDVYTGTLITSSSIHQAFYVSDDSVVSYHVDSFDTVTADECLAYRWVEVTPCKEHKDEDADCCCDYCFTPISHVYLFDDQDASYEEDFYIAKGEKVPRPDTDPVYEGYVFTGWYQFDLDKNNLGLFDFDKPVTDNIVIITALHETSLVATMCSGNVVFGSGLELQFRMEFTDDLLTNHPNAEVVFIKNDQVVKTVPITNPDLVEDGKSYFRVPVDMREYKTDVYVKVMDGDDEILLVHPDGTTAYENNACKYSVVQYARDVVTNHWDDQKMVNLAAYAVGYCEYVTRFFDYDDLTEYGWYPNIGNFQYTQDKVEKYGVKKTDNNVDGCTGASLNVDFMHINTLRLTFKFDGSHSIGDYSFTVDNKPVQPTDLGNGKYAFYVTDIIAADIVKPHTFTVTRNGTQESFTVTASVMSYALLASQNAKTSDMKKLGIALYCYGEAADAFFNII